LIKKGALFVSTALCLAYHGTRLLCFAPAHFNIQHLDKDKNPTVPEVHPLHAVPPVVTMNLPVCQLPACKAVGSACPNDLGFGCILEELSGR